jgi:hypothetical protein
MWMGGSTLVDFVTFANFGNIDDFMQTPGSVRASVELNKLGREDGRLLLRRYVAEDNADVIFNWERASAAMGIALFFLVLFTDQPQRITMGGVLLMTAIVLGQHFLTPAIASMGRTLDDLPPGDPARASFGALHGTYSTLEIAKVAIGLIVGWRLVVAEARTLAAGRMTKVGRVATGG